MTNFQVSSKDTSKLNLEIQHVLTILTHSIKQIINRKMKFSTIIHSLCSVNCNWILFCKIVSSPTNQKQLV